jgi:SAM-dependent methyltransferase
MLKLFPNNTPNPCPVCGSALFTTGQRYFLDEIFALWKPIEFSNSIVSEHIAISPFTELFKCGHCELEIFLPQVIGKQSFYEAVFAGQALDLKDYYEESKWEFYEALRDLAHYNSLIEFGCGTGNFLEMAKVRVPDVAGVELNQRAAEKAQKKGIKVYNADQIPDDMHGCYDAAVSFHVMEHVSDPKAFLESLSAFVKPDGVVSISVPNQAGPIRYVEPCAMNMPPHHATRWRLRTVEVLAERLGWKIERVAYEPLLLENHSYYSVYWLQQIMPGSSGLRHVVRHILSFALRAVFGLLHRMGMKYFWPLRGQTIYVIMSTGFR